MPRRSLASDSERNESTKISPGAVGGDILDDALDHPVEIMCCPYHSSRGSSRKTLRVPSSHCRVSASK